MSYFVKLLPIEGTIEENSWVLHKGKAKKVKFLYIGENSVNLNVVFESEEFEGSLLDCELGKYFLCSKDIKIGDKVIMPSQYEPYFEELKVVETPLKALLDNMFWLA